MNIIKIMSMFMVVGLLKVQKYIPQKKDNIFSEITRMYLDLGSDVIWYDTALHKISQSAEMKGIDGKIYSRIIKIETMPADLSHPNKLLKILKEEGFK